jgi:hypothetical protein
MSALGLILLSTAILIAPSMQHRIVEAGQSTPRLIRTTNMLSGAALVPLAIGMTLSAYIVTQRAFGPALGLRPQFYYSLPPPFAGSALNFLSAAIRDQKKCRHHLLP